MTHYIKYTQHRNKVTKNKYENKKGTHMPRNMKNTIPDANARTTTTHDKNVNPEKIDKSIRRNAMRRTLMAWKEAHNFTQQEKGT